MPIFQIKKENKVLEIREYNSLFFLTKKTIIEKKDCSSIDNKVKNHSLLEFLFRILGETNEKNWINFIIIISYPCKS